MTRTALLFASVAGLALAAPSAFAQEAAPAAAENDRLEDIVVTARRQNESLQTAPVAVTALTAATIDRLNIQDVNAVPQLAPNLSILQQSTSITAASIFIRGIGNQEPSSVAEQGVGVYLDGVYIGRSAGAIFDLVDMERIEVLRGPQGTLFGRNSVGGAIQLITKKPKEDLGVEIKAGYGNNNEWFARGRIDSGQSDNSPLSASLSYLHRQRDGYVDNLLRPSSDDPGALNSDAMVLAVQGDFGDVIANYSFDYNQREGTAPYFQILAATDDFINYYSQSESLGGDPFIMGQGRIDPGLQRGFVDRFGKLRYDAKAKIQGHSLTLDYQAMDSLTLKSITAYRKFFQDTILTLSGNGNLRGVVLDPVTFAPSIELVNPYNGNNAPQKQHQFSQELQALGKYDTWNYVLGAYYFYEKASETNRQSLTFVLPGGQAGINLNPVQAFGGTTESMAAFGQVSARPFGEEFELTGGLRYTSDKKTIRLFGDVNPEQRGRETYENVSWLVSGTYQFTPSQMVYVRASSGYRSGGINPRTNVINKFDPETAIAYEAGFKGDFFDRRLRTNLAIFYTDYDDLQVQQFASGTGGATSLIVNAGKVTYKGFEAEITAVPVDGLQLEASAGYTDPDYKEFLYRDPVSNEVINVADEARMPQTSKFQARGAIQYSTPVSFGSITGRVDYAYRSTIYFFALDRVNPFNRDIRSRPDHNLKARLSFGDIEFGGTTAEFSLWGDNLTNDKNIDFSVDFGGLGFGAGSYKRPRSYGADAKFSF
ncbi:TonB-dependent receptor [Sphingomonas sp. DBB INV C78]|uniref:TonB-dependent receptor n=1 Tax=Sphingomonas sp. DBB INV C78 TaxID=3349434 RepID=UPI0036D3C8E6